VRRSRAVALSLALFAVAGAAPLYAAGTPKIETPPPEAPTPEQLAAEHYNTGVAQRDEAWRLERKLAAAEPAQREKLGTKIRRAYEQAVKSFTRAVESDPGMHEAWAGLGYALRRTGDPEAGLEAYGRALEIAPDYGPALEYLGEAYLELDRLADARGTYERLEGADATLARELLSAMHSWVAARRSDPGEVKVGELDAFERWVSERLAGEPVESSLRKPRSW